LYAALTGTPSVGAVSATNTVSTTGIVPSAGNLLINSTDVSAYRSVTLQTTYSGSGGGNYQAQVSPDGTNWIYISGQYSTPSSSGSTTSSYLSGASGNYFIGGTLTTFSLAGVRFFRAYVTAGSGTGTVATTAFFSSLPVQPTLVQDSANNLGTVSNNAATSSVTIYNSSSASSGTVIIGPLACGNYRSIGLQIPTLVGGISQIQISNDNLNWTPIWANLVSSATPSSVSLGCNQTGFWYASLYGAQYVRVILTTVVTGSSSWEAVLSQQIYPVNAVGAVISSTLNVIPSVSTAQGFATYFTLVSAAGTNATSVKASAGTIGTCVLTNTTASLKFVKVFNKASSPTMGTDTPVIQYPISANSTLDVSSAFAGLRLSTGIALATTGGSALLDNTSVAAGDVLVNMTYV
jgi:hypothetical protein